jgi:hypothetical protein
MHVNIFAYYVSYAEHHDAHLDEEHEEMDLEHHLDEEEGVDLEARARHAALVAKVHRTRLSQKVINPKP